MSHILSYYLHYKTSGVSSFLRKILVQCKILWNLTIRPALLWLGRTSNKRCFYPLSSIKKHSGFYNQKCALCLLSLRRSEVIKDPLSVR